MSSITQQVPAQAGVLREQQHLRGTLSLHWDERYPLEGRAFFTPAPAPLIAEQPWLFPRDMLRTLLADPKGKDATLGEGRLHVAIRDHQLALGFPLGAEDAVAVVVGASNVPLVRAWVEATYLHRPDETDVDDWLREAGLA